MCHKQSEILLEKGLINPASPLHEAIFCWSAQKTPIIVASFVAKKILSNGDIGVFLVFLYKWALFVVWTM